MFKKNKSLDNIKRRKKCKHNLKPLCIECNNYSKCDFKLTTCNKITGFIIPCETCKNINECVWYTVAEMHDKSIIECSKWERKD